MKFMNFLLFVLIANFAFGQEQCVEILLRPEYQGNIALYSDTNKHGVKFLHNDVAHEDYLAFELLQRTDSFYFVRAFHLIDSNSDFGWIRKADTNLIVYRKPTKGAFLLFAKPRKIVGPDTHAGTMITRQDPVFTLLDFAPNWVYVREVGKSTVGWLEASTLCIDVYNRCYGN
jgi:hypothetical protein